MFSLSFAPAAPLRALLGCLLLAVLLPVRAELMLHPTRIVFDKNARAAQIELINNGSKAASYRISLVNRRMTEAGQFEAADAPIEGERFADPMLRYSPRQVTLQPGTAQTVRVMLRKPADLAEGEYRSHLQFDKLPEAEGNTSIENQAAGGTQIGVVMNALVGASVPVIVRHGNTGVDVKLTGLALRKEDARQFVLALQFEREGNSSVYGDIHVSFMPKNGTPVNLAQVGGIAVYTPNRVRKASLPLQVPAGLALAGGTLQVSYRDRPEAGGKLLAEASLNLP
ncbi:fimbria/pilus periplasmic chaperone [Massilia sp. Dwa41.01b]|uniref:fimbrial biogenesis chaperone n=1 Tax=unclassified Massilia TaxID=2609279 RepID=UPI0016031A2B|nr:MULTISPECIES: fimbria/pilus periplasmic chaperone [unclassified Massilia]QNA90350.1 fimbria/pilus periplasmic chaperone [Massilia sp. Dwa41.01b]QNA97575.1 fimbria/pilus periplasmic chaperone [Massilia sp. Se16.2.3]